VGSLEPGNKADLFMVNLRRPHLVPTPRVVSAFVHNGQPADIEDVMVDGQWLMRDSKVLTIDEDDIIQQAERIGYAVWQRLVRQFPSVPFPVSLPPGPVLC
jgi:5-methylthioadenosine/S-adenosylhomocysteine deaminase